MVQYHLLTATLFVLISTNLASCFVIPTGSFSFPTRSRHACGISKSILKPGRGSDDLSADTGVRTGARKLRHRLDAKKKKAGSAGRPSLDDVERLSRGQAAKKRGTGSRGVCHRLNESERKVRLEGFKFIRVLKYWCELSYCAWDILVGETAAAAAAVASYSSYYNRNLLVLVLVLGR